MMESARDEPYEKKRHLLRQISVADYIGRCDDALHAARERAQGQLPERR
jgi:hypothetical protein